MQRRFRERIDREGSVEKRERKGRGAGGEERKRRGVSKHRQNVTVYNGEEDKFCYIGWALPRANTHLGQIHNTPSASNTKASHKILRPNF